MKGLCNCISGIDPGGFAVAPSDPPFKYKRAVFPFLNYFPPSFLSIFSKYLIFYIIAKMAFVEPDLVRCYDDGSVVYANIGLKKTRKISDDLATVSKS